MIFVFCDECSMRVEYFRRGRCQCDRRETRIHVGATEFPSPSVLAQGFNGLLISITQSVAKPHTIKTPCTCKHVIVLLRARDKETLTFLNYCQSAMAIGT